MEYVSQTTEHFAKYIILIPLFFIVFDWILTFFKKIFKGFNR